MIVPQLKGGLCNQMFQIAACFAYAKMTNNKCAINYNLPFSAHQGNHPQVYKETVYRRIDQTNIIPDITYTQPTNIYSDIPSFNDAIFNGYFQSYKYFYKFTQDTQQLFTLSSNNTDNIVKKLNTLVAPICVMHVRRGDYLQSNISSLHYVCNTAYYKKCINLIPDLTSIIVVTDDTNYVIDEFKEEFDSGKLILANTNNDVDDLFLITQADYIIGSNSTFSWWGAYLNTKKQKCFFPDKWFTTLGSSTIGSHELFLDYMTLVTV